jgi:hypothetical protein
MEIEKNTRVECCTPISLSLSSDESDESNSSSVSEDDIFAFIA